ncbi:MAG: Ig-like domain-containing protein, partial [Candidatus Micrarchaeota archaeon]
MNWRTIFAVLALVLIVGVASQAHAVFVSKSLTSFKREYVKISPATASLRIGETQRFTASYYLDGKVVKNASITWSVSGPQATISSKGLLTAVSEGNVTVTASTPSLSSDPREIARWPRLVNATASAQIASNGSMPPTIEVLRPDRDDLQRIPGIDVGRVSVEINTSISTLSSGNELTLRAVARDGLGLVMPNATFDWTTSD